ncbi:MAG: GAF domain-containing sensor histidine kinase [Phycicoccus sp.]|nr:GAF domain-containing sensor histidine kinase [Phycicoccus sp.]NMM35807.1 GAF domain-containing sensor histidine kinase [Phycicoccus sp.]
MHQPSTRAAERWAYKWVDRRLKVLSVLLPVAFILALEFVHYTVEGRDLRLDGFWDGYRPLFIGVTVVSILAFGLVMFRFIDRAQRQVVRQNRELAAMNAVSSAVQGEVGVDQIVDVALESVLITSGAVQASVTVFNSEDRSPEGAGVTRRLLAAPGSASLVPNDPRGGDAPIIDFPLSTGTVTVGQMRLWLPVGAGAGDRLASGTLQTIGHQLASAIQLAQLVADLQRRKYEGHAFYDVLLQISNQNPPPDILSAVVQHARELMGSDEAVLSLDEDASRSVQFAGASEGGGSFAEGTSCMTSEAGSRHQDHGPATVCPIRSSPDWNADMAVPIRGPIGLLGELWIGRRSDVLFTERDRAFLVTLSGLAAIAITSAQMRENGRQRAVLAERERIAREMHDSLAQVLGVTHLRLRALDTRDEVCQNPIVAVELAEIADICEDAYQDVRESILGLRDSSKTERGLEDNLRAYLVKYSQQSKIEASLSSVDHELALSPRCEVQVIRVIQEALTNVRKHSGAKSAVVRITESDSSTTFVVEDDGHGFDQGGSTLDRDGFGLFTMRERMALLNGSLTIDSAPGRGTRVTASVPERSHPRTSSVEVMNAGARTDPHPAR